MHAHGGNIYHAARECGCQPQDILDFSASINPLGPSLRAIRVLRQGLWAVRHYPDPDAHDLRRALAKHFGIDPSCFLIGNGSSELIYLLPAALSLKRALIVGPAFSEYARAMTQWGGQCSYVQAERKDQYRPHIQKIIDGLGDHRAAVDAVFLCNPNSPTAQILSRHELLQVVQCAAKHGRWMVLDETFIEFCEEESLSQDIAHYSRLLVLRSFTKFYGLPGLRIGYLVSHPHVIQQLQGHQPPWSVNALAQTAALAALKDRGHRRKSLAFMKEERERFSQALTALPGVHVFSSAANFLLLELPQTLPVSTVMETLRQSRILVRDCSDVPGINGWTIRVSINTTRDNNALVGALGRIYET
jgi:threonine-phosphate decarboxylase